MTTSSSGPGQDRDRKKQFLVLVDPFPDNLFETGMLLQRFEYNVFTTATAEEALQYMAIAVPAALITELQLPAMDGMELISRVKENDRTRDVPVIVHTNLPGANFEELCKLAGCAVYLRKPVEHDRLYRVLQAAVESTPRHYIRLNTRLRVVIGDTGTTTSRNDYVTALSENGIFIRTPDPRPVNTLLPVTFFLADRPITVRGRVLYSFLNAAGPLREPGMGMKFADISGEDREFLREFIKDELMRDLVSRDRHTWRHPER